MKGCSNASAIGGREEVFLLLKVRRDDRHSTENIVGVFCTSCFRRIVPTYPQVGTIRLIGVMKLERKPSPLANIDAAFEERPPLIVSIRDGLSLTKAALAVASDTGYTTQGVLWRFRNY